MSAVVQKVASMLNMLPEQDQNLAFEIVKKMVLAWDPDYTKLTPLEYEAIEEAEQEIARGETVGHDEIDWA